MAYRNFPIVGLLGLNEDENPHQLRAEELTVARNVARRSSNLVGTRPGCVVLGSGEDYEDSIASAAAIQGAVEYRQDFDTNRALVVVADSPGAGTFPNSKISFEDDARLDDAVTPVITAGQNNIWTFALHNNLLWAAGGASADDIWTWDGNKTGPSAPVVRALTDKLSGARLRPKFIKEWRGYLLLNGFRTASPSNTVNAAVSRFQDFGSDPTLDASWPDSNSIGFSSRQVGVDTFGGAFTTGFGTYHDNENDYLLVLSNNQIASFVRDPTGTSDFVRNDIIGVGCVHQRAFVDLGPDAGDSVFVSSQGIHSLRQSQQHGNRESAFLSRKIETTFNSLGINRLELTTTAYDRRNGRIVFAFTAGAGTKHDILMALDVRHPEALNARDALWYGPWVLPAGANVNQLLYARDASNDFHIYAFTTDGRVLRFAEDVFHDLVDDPIEMILRTKDEPYDQVSLEKRLGDTTVTVGPGGDHTVDMEVEFDYGAKVTGPFPIRLPTIGGVSLPVALPFTLSPASQFADVKLYTTGRGRTIAQRFSNFAADEPFFLARIERQVAGAGEDTGAKVR